ncbi:putative vacuolar protein sorting-associated protein TDA6 [Erysiphe neolycopersici]|uniref:Putative vacuolar protein sorting-associated protein TDA6 n=1 Tax=Erysiphe neolycopersici TaxID=212602 RepID=A0A420HSE8_9PEZI|nr:putative vacuolar protein sorting-associated protein TDA6 [Erysiphe neolycopersici]
MLSFFVQSFFILSFCSTTAFSSTRLSRRGDQIPQFVKDFAPLVFLDKNEKYYPSDIAKHIENTTPFVNKTAINPSPSITVENLDLLNQFNVNETKVYLTLKEPVENNPTFLLGTQPDENGKTVDATSCVVIVKDHGDGNVDAFYMYFYSFDKGNVVLSQELGNHVGDWEHTMVRFKSGSPEALWLSQHAYGQAFSYGAMKKQGDRAIVYSATGTHANYATDGDHDHTIPGVTLPKGLLVDHTSEGKLWDPVKSANFYTFDPASNTINAVDSSPVGIMNFKGRWGDAEYSGNSHGQQSFFGFKKYVDGPTGPLDKDLNRKNICPDRIQNCDIKNEIGAQPKT